MNPELQRRETETITVQEGRVVTVDLPRVHDMMSLMVDLSGTLTVSSAASSIPAHAPAELIQRVDIIANGKEAVYAAPFRMACFGNYARDFTNEITAPGTSVAAHPFKAVGMIDFSLPDGFRPKDTAFQSYGTNLLQARITFGTLADIVTGGAATVAGTVALVVDELREPKDAGERKLFRKVTHQRETWTASNSNLRIPMPVGNAIRSLTVLATDDGAPSDSVVNSLKFARQQTDIKQSLTWSQMRSFNRADKRLAAAPPAGFAVLDPLTDVRRVTNVIDLRNVTQADLVLDVAAPGGTTGAVDILVEEVLGL